MLFTSPNTSSKNKSVKAVQRGGGGKPFYLWSYLPECLFRLIVNDISQSIFNSI